MVEARRICRFGDTRFTALSDGAKVWPVIASKAFPREVVLAKGHSVTVDIVKKKMEFIVCYDADKIGVDES